MVPANEPKLPPADGDPLGIDFRPLRQPIHAGLAGRLPAFHRHVDAERRALVLARPFHREHREAAVQVGIAIQPHARFLEAVHAGNEHDHRNAAAGIAGRQMEPGRQRLAVERNPHRLDAMIGEPGVAP